MTKYIKCGGGGLPPQVITDMNAVLNKKFGTSTTYPSSSWPSNIEKMTALPEESASGSIAHFTDGADTVPLKSLTLTLAPTQSGTGDPSPSNPRPISGVSSVDVVVCGANFMDASTLYSDFEQSDGSFLGLGSDFNSLYFYIPQDLVGVEVTFSAYIKIPEGSTITNPRVSARVNGTNTNGNAVTSSVYTLSSVTFTPTSTSDHVRITYGSNGSQPVQFKEPQLEVGAVVTPFVEYSAPTTTTLALGSTVYGLTGDCVTGEFEETWSDPLLVDGSFSVNAVSQSGGTYFVTVVVNLSSKNTTASNITVYSDKFVTRTGLGGGDNHCYITNSGKTLVCVLADQTITTKAQATQWFEDNPTNFVYKLATPTALTIDPVEVESFKGVNNVWHDGNGDTAVTYRADIDLYVNEHS